jgi:MarR family 2-MHQ and catechol resistance regulon transcriptional repressor
VHGVDDPDIEEAVRAYVKLMRAARAVTACLERRLAAEGLTGTQLGVLEVILHKGPLTHRELGRKLLISAGNMTEVIDKLEARGLVRRMRDVADRRQVQVELTARGRALITKVFPRHAANIARAMRGLDKNQLRRLGNLLRTLGMTAARNDAEAPPLATGRAAP